MFVIINLVQEPIRPPLRPRQKKSQRNIHPNVQVYFGHIWQLWPSGQCATNFGKWGILEKNYKKTTNFWPFSHCKKVPTWEGPRAKTKTFPKSASFEFHSNKNQSTGPVEQGEYRASER